MPPKSIYGATCFPTYLRKHLKKLLWKTFYMFLTTWILDNRHICYCYLLIFNSLYRKVLKTLSLQTRVCQHWVNNIQPNQSKQPFQLRFVPQHVLHFWKPIFLLILQVYKFVISCLIDHLSKQRNCECFDSFQLCSHIILRDKFGAPLNAKTASENLLNDLKPFIEEQMNILKI